MRRRWCLGLVLVVLWWGPAGVRAQDDAPDPTLVPTDDGGDADAYDLHGSLARPDPFAQTPPPKPPPPDYPNEEARGRTARNLLFVEVGGPAVFDSLNYGRIVADRWLLRLGVGAMALPGVPDGTVWSLAMPLSLSYVGIRWGSHALELGLAATLRYVTGPVDGPLVHDAGGAVRGLGEGHVGYHYMPVSGGFGWRAGVALLVGPGVALSLDVPRHVGALPWAYVSAGWVF